MKTVVDWMLFVLVSFVILVMWPFVRDRRRKDDDELR